MQTSRAPMHRECKPDVPLQRVFIQKDEHKFSCAHMTIFPDGTKERLHGHNYRVGLAVEMEHGSGRPLLDFFHAKRALTALCTELREHLLLPMHHPLVRVVSSNEHEVEVSVCSQRYVVPLHDVLWLPISNITVEELAGYVWQRLAADLASALDAAGALRLEVQVTEAPGQGATHAAPWPHDHLQGAPT